MTRLLDPERVITAIERAFGDRFSDFVIPARYSVDLPSGILLLMPCCERPSHTLGVKVVTVDSGASGGVQATYLLFSPDTGQIGCVLPANAITDMRTAATSAVATKYLASPKAGTLGIFGAGRQAWAHLLIMPRVCSFDRILICASPNDHSRKVAQRASEELSLKVEVVDADTCAAQSDVVCTCTTAKSPIFDGSRLRPGTHLNVVGAFRPVDREVDDIAVLRSKVVVDTYEGAFAEAGDLLIPMRNGRIDRAHIIADLHEVVTGKKQVRRSPEDITLFKSVGCALEDFVTAELVKQHVLPSHSA